MFWYPAENETKYYTSNLNPLEDNNMEIYALLYENFNEDGYERIIYDKDRNQAICFNEGMNIKIVKFDKKFGQFYISEVEERKIA